MESAKFRKVWEWAALLVIWLKWDVKVRSLSVKRDHPLSLWPETRSNVLGQFGQSRKERTGSHLDGDCRLGDRRRNRLQSAEFEFVKMMERRRGRGWRVGEEKARKQKEEEEACRWIERETWGFFLLNRRKKRQREKRKERLQKEIKTKRGNKLKDERGDKEIKKNQADGNKNTAHTKPFIRCCWLYKCITSLLRTVFRFMHRVLAAGVQGISDSSV